MQNEKKIIFEVTNPDSLSDALKEISDIKDEENQEIHLTIKVSEKYDKDFVVPVGYDNVFICIHTFILLNNTYDISSGTIVVRESKRDVLPFGGYRSSANLFKFSKESIFSGDFKYSNIKVFDNASGAECATGEYVNIELYGKSASYFICNGDSFVEVFNNATYLGKASEITVYDEGVAYAKYGSFVKTASQKATVYAYNNSRVVGYEANIHLYDNSFVQLYHNAKNLTCHDESIVYAYYDYQGNNPHYRIANRFKNEKRWYKAVIKDSQGIYHSIFDYWFTYEIGGTVTPNAFDENPSKECGGGIHLSTLKYAIDFSLAHPTTDKIVILELTPTPDATVIIPYESEGKIRVSEAKVLREVPWEELGEFKAIAKLKKFVYSEEM